MGFKGLSALLLIIAITGCCGSPASSARWRPLNVNLYRVVGSIHVAAAYIRVEPILPALSAFGKDPGPNYNMYRVTFKARRFGWVGICWAEVHWDWDSPMGLRRFVKNFRCW